MKTFVQEERHMRFPAFILIIFFGLIVPYESISAQGVDNEIYAGLLKRHVKDLSLIHI